MLFYFSVFRSLMIGMVSEQQSRKQSSLMEEEEVRSLILSSFLFIELKKTALFLKLFSNTMILSSTDKLNDFYVVDPFESFTRDMRSRFDEGKYCLSETFWC